MLSSKPFNRAAELGPQRFAWWPKWQDKTVAIVACGRSLKNIDLSPLRGRVPVIAIKEAAVELAPWSDAVYGCDGPWWKYRQGLPQFKGLKFAWDGKACAAYSDLIRVEIPDRKCGRILLDEPLTLGAGGDGNLGGNSGFQCVNLAAQFSVGRILLLGFDMQGTHFYGRNKWPKANNPHDQIFRCWVTGFETAAPRLKQLGIDVINASPVSALNCFRKMSFADAVKECVQ